MNLDAIVQNIDAEISHLEKARALLTGHTARKRKRKDERRLREGEWPSE
jgi:hypothetical protein